LLVIADEIYDKLLFDRNKHVSIASLNKDLSCVTFSGLSKNYVAPGFRIGWASPADLKKNMQEYLDAVIKYFEPESAPIIRFKYAVPIALNGDQSHLTAMNCLA